MKRDLPLLKACWLNAPLACTDDYAITAAAVFSGRLDIRSLITQHGIIEKEEMAAIAIDARMRADAKRAKWMEGTNLEVAGNIAVIRIYGALTRSWGIGPYSGSTGYDGIRIQLEDALKNDEIDGIWLDINSGGGTVDGMYDLADLIFMARSTHPRDQRINAKPIWAMAADYAYSAAYLLGTCADRFYCPELGGCLSIGTVTMHTSYKRMLQEEGIDVSVLRWPEDKFKPNSMELLDDDTRKHIMVQLQAHGEAFQQRVARNMKASKSAVAETKGRDYTGSQAKAIGLVTDALPETIVWEMFRRHVAKQR